MPRHTPLHLALALTLVGVTVAVPAGPAHAADLADTFDGATVGTTPAGWTVGGGGGDATVADVAGTGDRSLRLTDTSTAAPVTATRSFGVTSATVVANARLRAAQTTAVVGLHLDSVAGHTVTVAMDGAGRLYTYSGATRVDLGAYTANRWYDVRIVARPGTSTASVWIDGQRRATNLSFRVGATSLAAVQVGVAAGDTGTAWVDDVRTKTEPNPVSWPQVGTVAPRSAAQIGSSKLIVGAETLDRDYTDYQSYKGYLGPLGATRARFQAGWAKTEKVKGSYDWAWLDTVVNDAVSRGVRPWLQTSYGNPIYTGGGGAGLGGQVPSSAEALAAWDAWVRALVNRYSDRVDEWEIWNEPNLGGVDTTVYADFLVRTATRVRAAQPGAVIWCCALAGVERSYADAVLTRVRSLGKLDLIDGITYHPYNANPDASYEQVRLLRVTADSFSPDLLIRQGENGAPSRPNSFGALGELNWTELAQAKWMLRRTIADLGRGISTSVFSISDLHYPSKVNSKGLVRTGTDKKVRYAKPSYYAIQSAAALFDDTMTPINGYGYTDDTTSPVAVQAFRKSGTGRQSVALWFNSATPGDDNTRTPVTVTFSAGSFADPVYVDPRTGAVYDIPAANWSQSGTSYTFTGVPLYDSPILIADRSVIGL
ncbi:hypothetical protein [Micromonospora sp. CPCC 205556]|uniref:hypothetical protein n=1 Tax=Micromonospora sp. CPCC 205556 TaxID=3122398 RepID=UPI002FF1DE22